MCRREDIINKIMERVVSSPLGFMIDGEESPCLLWQGPTSGTGRGGGYPRMSLNGQTVAVHLVVFTHYYGFIPGKKQIDHRCNNRLCVNPDHLQMVSHKKNQALRAERTRGKTNVQASIIEDGSAVEFRLALCNESTPRSLPVRGGEKTRLLQADARSYAPPPPEGYSSWSSLPSGLLS